MIKFTFEGFTFRSTCDIIMTLRMSRLPKEVHHEQ